MSTISRRSRRSWLCIVALALTVCMGSALPTVAQTVPQLTKIQGYLSDTSGASPVPANGFHSIQFEVYDASVAGTLVASVGPLNVNVSDGLYDVDLPLTATLFQAANRYLQLTVNGESLSPRIQLVAVPYAFNSSRADSVAPDAIDAVALASGAVTLDALGIVCQTGEILIYTMGTGWSCGSAAGPAQIVCELGSYAHCYTGATGTAGVGLCLEGRSDCKPDQTGFDSCVGEVTPMAELCGNGIDDDCDGAVDCADGDCATDPACTACPDNDADGYTNASCGGTDCNDNVASINPGAAEICDGLDNDCNPGTADGAGEPSVGTACDGADSDLCAEGVISCAAGALTCGDLTGNSLEICNNSIDDDCDGATDCADGDCTTDPACTACPDNDADGFTDAACGGTDCNDNVASINPGAAETCDGLDNDCNPGTADGAGEPSVGTACDGADSDLCAEGVISCAAGSLTCGDLTGNSLEICNNSFDDDCDGATDCADGDCTTDPACTACPDNDADGFTDAACGGTDCNDNVASINPGAAETCDGLDNDCNPGTADGAGEPSVGTACDGADSDLCAEGVISCAAGALTCGDLTGDSLEICNNSIDDDCDGATDCADGDCSTDPAC